MSGARSAPFGQQMVPRSGSTRTSAKRAGITQLFEHAIDVDELCNVHLSMDAIVEFQIKTVPTERPDLDDIFDHGVTVRWASGSKRLFKARVVLDRRAAVVVSPVRGRKPIG